MTVYVDNFDSMSSAGRGQWSHMIADTEEELHEMAEKIGLHRSWFQDPRVEHADSAFGPPCPGSYWANAWHLRRREDQAPPGR